MDTMKNLILLVLCTQLGACAVMNKQECLNANWRDIGYHVAFDGAIEPSKPFITREKACGKHEVTANQALFEQGFEDGRVHHCQLENAVHLGIDGHTKTINNNLCPSQYYPGFANAFRVGHRLNHLRYNVHASRHSISELDRKIHNSRKRIRKIKDQISSSDDSNKEINKSKLREESKKLRKRISRAQREIYHYEGILQEDLAKAEHYESYIYNEYLYSLDNRFVDPREVTEDKPKRANQTKFEDRIDDILNQ